MWTPAIQSFVILGLGFALIWRLSRGLGQFGLVHAGILFFGLGVLVGPRSLGFVDLVSLGTVEPVVAVLVGWVGLLVGMGLTVRKDGGLVDGAIRTGLVYTLVAVALFGTATYMLFGLPLRNVGEGGTLAIAAITAAGLTGSPWVVRRVAARYQANGKVRDTGESLTRVVRVAALATLAIALAFASREGPGRLSDLAPTEWLLGELLVGFALGLVTDAFLGEEPDDDRMLASLLGATLFTTGVAWHLGLSPLILNGVVGLTLANFGRRPAVRHQAILGLELPTTCLLLCVTGAIWQPPEELLTYGIAGALLGLRLIILAFGGAVAARALDPTSAGLRRVGFMAVGQGAPAVAIALTVTALADPDASHAVLTVVLASVLLNDMWASPAARLVLDEAGEIPTLLGET